MFTSFFILIFNLIFSSSQMVADLILKPLAAEATKPYMQGIRLRGGKVDHLIDTEIILILSNN